MDIQATKLEQVLQRIKVIFEQEEDMDFWDSLSLEDRAAIDEGLEQLKKEQYVSHESVRKKIKSRFNF